jgi:hypothetical protein
MIKDTAVADYEVALAAARAELDRRLQERRQLEGRIAWLQATVAGLEHMVDPQPSHDHPVSVMQSLLDIDLTSGLTDSCRKVIAAAGRALQASEVIKLLELGGFDIGRYANPLAAVSTTLHRMAERAKSGVGQTTTPDGNVAYYWATSQAPKSPTARNLSSVGRATVPALPPDALAQSARNLRRRGTGKSKRNKKDVRSASGKARP